MLAKTIFITEVLEILKQDVKLLNTNHKTVTNAKFSILLNNFPLCIRVHLNFCFFKFMKAHLKLFVHISF